jgi:hypothetical protein
VDQAHEANHYQGRDGKTDGAFKHAWPGFKALAWEVIAWVGVFNG